MINKMLGRVATLDAQKVMTVVNLVWDNREKFRETTNIVWENREKLTTVVNLVWENRATLAGMMEQLPALLQETGQQLEAAGQSATQVGALLAGGTLQNSPSIHQLTQNIAGTLEQLIPELEAAATALEQGSSESDPLADNAVALQESAQRVKAIGRHLDITIANLHRMNTALTEAGQHLNQLGMQLEQSGKTLYSLTAALSAGDEDADL